MRFVHPSMLIWAALVAVPIILYLVRPRPRSVRVTTLPFFMSLSRAAQESSWLRRLKQLLSLLLSVAVIAVTAFALARLVVSPPADALQTVVLLVDRSASMQARAGGQPRLDQGLRQLRDRLAGLPGSPGIAVIAYDRRPEILLSRSRDELTIQRALEQIVARPIAGNTARALQAACELAAVETPAVVWHVTDHPAEPPDAESTGAHPSVDNTESDSAAPPTGNTLAAAVPSGVSVEEILVGSEDVCNAGITALELRRLPQQRADMEAFVQVEATLAEPRDAELEVALDGALIDLRKLTLRPGHPERLLLSLKADPQHESILAVTVKLAGDTLACDDLALARVPRAQRLKILWLSRERDPFTELALSSFGAGYDVLVGGPEQWPPAERPSVVVFDGWTPAKWPDDLPAVVINPPAAFGPVRVARLEKGGVPVERVRAANPRHPLLFGVATDRVSLWQTAVIDSGGVLEPLWVSDAGGPLLLAGQVRGQSLAVLACDPARSESLPLLATYPLLLGNAVNWAAQDELRADAGRNQRTGDLVDVGSGATITWNGAPAAATASASQREQQVPVPGRWCELDRIGCWHTADGPAGTASLLSAGETRLTAVAASPSASKSAPGFSGLVHGDLTLPLVWCVLGMLLAESWLFHRKAVY